MKELDTNYMIIKSSDLEVEKPYDVEVMIPSKKEYYLRGIVYDKNSKPLPHVFIEIVEIDKLIGSSKVIGTIFSNDKGEYAFEIFPKPNIDNIEYKIVAHSPLIKNSKSDKK